MNSKNPLPPKQQEMIGELEAIADRIERGEIGEIEARRLGDEVIERFQNQSVADIESKFIAEAKARRRNGTLVSIAIIIVVVLIAVFLPK